MQEERVYRVFPSDLDIAESFRLAVACLHELGYTKQGKGSHATLQFGQSRSLNTSKFPEFLKLLEQNPQPNYVYLDSSWLSKGGTVMFGVTLSQSRLTVVIDGDDAGQVASMHEKVREAFRASTPPAERSPGAMRVACRKTVFLAHGFDDVSSLVSAKVDTFLRRLGFDVRQGEGYQTRDIPDKVAGAIRSQDIFIAVVLRGDNAALAGEAGLAGSLGKRIIVLLEDGASFDPTTAGADCERIGFPPGIIEKAFSDLVYALPP
ncbi:MAG: hypothetical protein ACE15C_08400 [Phycisphaerae bacterium]